MGVLREVKLSGAGEGAAGKISRTLQPEVCLALAAKRVSVKHEKMTGLPRLSGCENGLL